MAGKTQRLSRVASELNVSISTIVDFLGSKGFSIDSNPNTKIEEDQYDVLLQNFADEISQKEKIKQASVKRERRESISLEDSKPKEGEVVASVEEDDIDIEQIKANIINKEVAPALSEKSEKVEEKTTSDNDGHQLQVLGKIDLDKLNTKTRPDKKKKEDVAPVEKKEESKPIEVKAPVVEISVDKPVEKKAEPVMDEAAEKVAEKPVAIEPKVEAPEIETIRVETKKITGPTILGKIELPVEKQKVASSSQAANKVNDLKKKRKRIKKGPENTTNAPKTDGTDRKSVV